MPTTTLLYAGLLGLIALALALTAGKTRAAQKVSVGDGGNAEVNLAMRRHANFVEWVPMILIIVALLELNGIADKYIHAFGIILVVTRIAHAIGLKNNVPAGPLRIIGALGSVLTLAVASIWAIVHYFS